ncbi:MAG: hypothetical protein HYW86_03775 [Candidatus Roizmanbacteria bacterium]|nr:MAG: hypothetical protein HYW86_03775 [Candidatus Roizmanbacteria bacterium]
MPVLFVDIPDDKVAEFVRRYMEALHNKHGVHFTATMTNVANAPLFPDRLPADKAATIV